MSYAPLWCKSNFSFLEGASHPEELVERAHTAGLSHLAVTDRDGLYGVVRAHVRAKELGVHLVIGAEVTVGDRRIVLLVRDRTGYTHLCRLLTKGRLRCPKGESRVTWDEVFEHAPGLVALSDGLEDAPLGALHEAFGDALHVLVTRHHQPDDARREAVARKRAGEAGVGVVAGVEVLYHSAARRPLQDVLTCIRHGVSIHKAGCLTRPNAEHELMTAAAFGQLFADDPVAREMSLAVAASCTFSLDELRYRYPTEQLPDGSTSARWLRTLAHEGAKRRYPEGVPPKVSAQLDKELTLIEELDYPGYFLTMHEIVRFCEDQGILCQGRGSAANSALCFCLGITAIDPARSNLLFERFLSKERAEPPDIDLDIEHDRREEVIQHVYDKYGRTHAAMVSVVIRYRPRSAVRDVGKALGLSETSLDRAARLLSHYGAVEPGQLAQAGLDMQSRTHQLLVELSNQLLDFPRHLSIHPGGFLLGHDPVHDIVPIENGTMADRTVIQWDKDDCEDLGLFKVDLLGLGALSLLDLCFGLLREHHGVELDVARIPPDDEATYDMICAADTVGTFQIESRAQMSMLPRLRPRTYYDLVIEVSLVRPGPITGGMVHPYLRRRTGQEAVTYPHPCLEPVLKRTLGVPLFQEQVMSLAMVAADYSAGEADQLRRDMAAWRKHGRLEAHQGKLVSRMMQKGIDRAFAERVFEQIRGFGEYGFPESHAASFAILSYATSYLKCHWPAEFACALLNAQPMGFYSPATILEDARRHGVTVLPVDVTTSAYEATLEPVATSDLLAIRVGLRSVKGVGEADARRLLEARARRPFADMDDLVRRSELGARAVTALSAAGAMDALSADRRDALWEAHRLGADPGAPAATVAPEDDVPFVALSDAELMQWDYATCQLSPRGHPVQHVRDTLTRLGLPDATSLGAMPDGKRVRYAGMVICRQRPGTAGGVVFMTLEDETGFVNLVVWQRVFEKHELVVKTCPFLGVTGKLQSKEGVVHLVADSLWQPQLVAPPSGGIRNFH